MSYELLTPFPPDIDGEGPGFEEKLSRQDETAGPGRPLSTKQKTMQQEVHYYKFTNPTSKKLENKTAYIEKYEDVIVGCGAYKK